MANNCYEDKFNSVEVESKLINLCKNILYLYGIFNIQYHAKQIN